MSKDVKFRYLGDAASLEKASAAAESSMGKVSGAASKVAGAVAAGVGGAAVGLAGFGLKAASDAEQSNIAFTSILGSADKAKAFLGDLGKFAAQTPFELPGLKDNASKLLAVGTEASHVIPLMRSLGDATSAMGTGEDGIARSVAALQKMQTTGKVSAETMMQLSEAGIPAWDALAAKLGVDVATAQQKVSDGQVKVNDVFSAIEGAAGPAMQRTKGMMDAQSQSFSGLISTLKDTAGQGLAGLFAPVLQDLKGMLPGINELLGDALKTAGPALAGVFSGIIAVAKPLLPVLGQVLTAVGGTLGKALAELAPVFAELVGNVTPLIGPLGQLASRLLGALLPAVLPLIGPIISLVGALVGTQDHAGPLVRIIDLLGRAIEAIPTPVLTAMVGAFVAFQAIGPVVGLFGALSGILPVLGGAFAVLLGPVGLVIAAIAGVAAVGYLVYRNWDTIKAALGATWEWISNTAVAVWDGIVGFFGGIGDAFIGIWTGIIDFTRKLLTAYIDFYVKLPGRIFAAIGNAASWLVNLGGDIITGLWNGLRSMAGRLFSGLPGLVKDLIPGQIRDALGIRSPSRVMAAIGVQAMQGLAMGLDDGAGLARRSVAELADDLARTTITGPGYQPGAGAVGVAGSGAGVGPGGGQLVEASVPIEVVLDRQVLARTTWRGLLELKAQQGALGIG